MRIKDGLKLPGRKVEIPDANREDFAKFLHDDMGFRVGAEIGVDKGEYGVVLCDAGLKMYGVDCYENYFTYKREGGYKSNESIARDNLGDRDYTIIVKYSQDALDDFEDESLDFVYIDGNHTLPFVVADIFGWERKVKRGGIVSGHDYARIKGYREPDMWDGCHVSDGVDACANVMKIDKYYILGERWSDNRDKWRSWFWIKK